MPRFQVAHINQQGVDLIIVPLNHDFGFKSPRQQQGAVYELQTRARAAGLRGTVVPVWEGSAGGMAFIAPKNWHPFFQSLSLPAVYQNMNRELYW